MIPINKVRDLISKHISLEKELSTGEIDKKKFAEKSKEYSDLSDVIKEAKEYTFYDLEKKFYFNSDQIVKRILSVFK